MIANTSSLRCFQVDCGLDMRTWVLILPLEFASASELLSPSQRLSISHVLLSSLMASRWGSEILLRARHGLNGKPTHFLAEGLRYALAGFGERPTTRT
jgi:hypothetical protein